ncbi:hypothetical protein B0T16DRAFT_356857, partial [Cercophora newfieldiana]
MLKSTYKPSAASQQPLPPGWSEHKAPTGHTYYYNAETKESTYKRPGAAPSAPLPAPPPQINLSDPNVANAFMSQYAAPPPQQQGGRGGFGAGGGRGGFQPRPKPQPVDKPRSKVAIPGCEPWILVYTKYGRRFAYNPVKNASYWRIPEKLMPAILELDQARIRQKATGETSEAQDGQSAEATASAGPLTRGVPQDEQKDYDSSEYEEVEVTDDEGDDDGAEGSAPKRQRTEEPGYDAPAEFTEADIAAQLAAMNAEYGSDMEYDDQDDEYDEAPPLSDADARALFKDLLDDFKINPYSPWDKLIEVGKVIPDPRYTVLPTTRARKEVWEEWSREKITHLKSLRATEEKKDPRIPYLAFLAEHATPKLYWPEFRRKYKKEPPLKDTKLSDKDREKYYREHINRLKLPQSTLKSDLKKLLQTIPIAELNNQTLPSHLPSQVLSDIRYISLPPSIRDPFIEGYIVDLPPPPSAAESADVVSAEERKAQEDRKKREKALQDRERVVAEEKRKQEKKLQFERARLREEERELQRAMVVDKRGLLGQLGA